ncbi:MAG: hypothetical protein MJ208_00725 [Bacilli bacterium]|nr:hypothetical protein [Bacilli bacterium]
MVKIEEYLSKYKEKTPTWLDKYNPGNKIDFNQMIRSKGLYYPGAGFDGTPIKILNTAGYCHFYIYVDNGVDLEDLKKELSKKEAFKGYKLLDKINITKEFNFNTKLKAEFALLAIYEKLAGNNIQGEKRFSLLYIKDDGWNVYRHLYSDDYSPSIILAENYMGVDAQFGKGSPLEKLVLTHSAHIPFLITNGDPWTDYKKVAVQGFTYGDGGIKRFLFKWSIEDVEKFAKEVYKKHKKLMDALAD